MLIVQNLNEPSSSSASTRRDNQGESWQRIRNLSESESEWEIKPMVISPQHTYFEEEIFAGLSVHDY